MHGARRAALALVLALVLGACGTRATSPPPATTRGAPAPGVTATTPAFPVTLTDDEGVRVTLEAPPRRIVTFAPSNTEIVFALGLGDRLVGVSGPFDDYPPEARTIEHVGGAGEFGVDPNVEKVVSLRPDLMLTIAGGEHWKGRLRELGVPVFTIDARDLDDLLHDILTVGRLTGALPRAEALVDRMRARAEAVAAAVRREPPVSCFFEVSPPPTLFTVGPGSFIFDLLRRAGCDPVTRGAKSPYPEWSVEHVVEADPQVYLVSSEAGVSVEAVAGRPGFEALTAVRTGRVYLVESDLVSRPGPRVVEGLEALARALHPEALPPS